MYVRCVFTDAAKDIHLVKNENGHSDYPVYVSAKTCTCF
jgi:hypothetical protein